MLRQQRSHKSWFPVCCCPPVSHFDSCSYTVKTLNPSALATIVERLVHSDIFALSHWHMLLSDRQETGGIPRMNMDGPVHLSICHADALKPHLGQRSAGAWRQSEKEQAVIEALHIFPRGRSVTPSRAGFINAPLTAESRVWNFKCWRWDSRRTPAVKSKWTQVLGGSRRETDCIQSSGCNHIHVLDGMHSDGNGASPSMHWAAFFIRCMNIYRSLNLSLLTVSDLTSFSENQHQPPGGVLWNIITQLAKYWSSKHTWRQSWIGQLRQDVVYFLG